MLSCSIFDTLRNHLRPEIPADDVAAERQRQPAGPLRPPLAEIHDLPQPFVLVRELPLVDQQSGLGLAVEHRLLNLIERHDDVLEVRLVDAQREVGRRERAGNRDAAALHAVRARGSRRPGSDGGRDDDRAVLVAHARAVRQQRVLVHQVRVGVKRHGGHLVLAVERRAIRASRCPQHLIETMPPVSTLPLASP